MSTPSPSPSTRNLATPVPAAALPSHSRHQCKRGEPRSPPTPRTQLLRPGYHTRYPPNRQVTHLCAVGCPSTTSRPKSSPSQHQFAPKPPSAEKQSAAACIDNTHRKHTRLPAIAADVGVGPASATEACPNKVQTPDGKLAGSGTGVVPCNSLPLPAPRLLQTTPTPTIVHRLLPVSVAGPASLRRRVL